MTPQDEVLVKRFRAKATDMELRAVDFIDGHGNISQAYSAIRCTFIDGTVIRLPRRLEKHFSKQVFKLRPVQDNS